MDSPLCRRWAHQDRLKDVRIHLFVDIDDDPGGGQMARAAIQPSDFDPACIFFDEIKTLSNGDRTVSITYDGGPMYVQTPEMRTPFGLGKWEAKNKYALDFSFDDLSTNARVRTFHDMARAMDRLLVEYAMANSTALFSGHRPRAAVEASYVPIVKPSRDPGRYPPTFHSTVPHKDGVFACEAYDTARHRVDLRGALNKGSRVAAIVHCSSVWLTDGKFGVTWKAMQLKVAPAAVRGPNGSFVDDEDARA